MDNIHELLTYFYHLKSSQVIGNHIIVPIPKVQTINMYVVIVCDKTREHRYGYIG